MDGKILNHIHQNVFHHECIKNVFGVTNFPEGVKRRRRRRHNSGSDSDHTQSRSQEQRKKNWKREDESDEDSPQGKNYYMQYMH